MIDLHIHTNASSDAFTSPEEVVSIALSNGVSAIAITDHQSVRGVSPAVRAGKELGVEVIPGVELMVTCKEAFVHIVGLFIDPQEPALLDHLTRLEAEHYEWHAANNQLKVGVLIGMGLPLTLEQVAHLVDLNMAWRKYIIRHLEDMGLIDPGDEEIKQELTDRFMRVDYYRYKSRKNKPETAIERIHQAGGLAVLAHPLRYGLGCDELDPLLVDLKRCGLDGMEVYCHDHDESQQKALLSLARKHRLLRSGGSDFHGYEKQNGRDIGRGLYGPLVPDDVLDEMKKRRI